MKSTKLRVLLTLFIVQVFSLFHSHCFAQTIQENGPRLFAIQNARIVLEPGKVIEKGTLIIRDGLIVAVGAKVKTPYNAEVIEGKGLTVYAGFIDAATSKLIDSDKIPKAKKGRKIDFTKQALATTRTDNRKGLIPDFRSKNALKEDSAVLNDLRKAGFTSMHILPNKGIAAGIGTLRTTATLPLRETILHSETFSLFHLYAMRGSTYPSTLMGAIAHLRQIMLDAKQYQQHQKLYNNGSPFVPRPPLDETYLVLNNILDKKTSSVFLTKSRDDIHRALDFANEFQIKPIITGSREAYRVVDRLSQEKISLIAPLDFPQQPTVKKNGSSPLRVQQDILNRWKTEVQGLKTLHQAKIPFAISSQNLKSSAEVLKNLRLAIQEGLPRDAALAALTTNAATLLGMQNRLGQLKPGYLGHVVVMTGPFDKKSSRVRYLFVNNKKHEYNKKSKPTKTASTHSTNMTPPLPPPLPQEKKNTVQIGFDSKKKENSQKKPSKTPQTKGDDIDSQPTELLSDRLKRPARTGGNVLIKNVIILTGTGKELSGRSILIRKGKIVAIGKGLKPAKGMQVIDGHGWHVMPGIIDTHSHIMTTGGLNEGTQSITPEVRVRDVINTNDVSEYRSLSGGVTTARLFHGSANVIGGQDAVVKLKYGATAKEHFIPNAPQGVKFALGENVKFRKSRFPNTRLGVEATLKRAFLEGMEYRQRWLHYNQLIKKNPKKKQTTLPPRRDLRLEAIADIINHKKFIHSHCYRADEILMLLRVASSMGVRVWSLQHVLEGYKIAPEIVTHGASCSTFADWWAYKVEAFDAIPYNAALLKEAGANVVIKSDNAELMRNLFHEAAKTVRYGGMSPHDALQTITLNAARELGLDERIGSIEVGKDADVAFFNGHPLNAFSRCEITMIEGEIYFQRSLAKTVMSKTAVKRSAKPSPLSTILPAAQKHVRRKLNLEKSSNGRYAIINATLYPVDRPIIPKGTILIDKGRIAAIGKHIKLPKGTRIINGKGLHITPGFIDAGTRIGLVEIGKVRETHDYAESGIIQPDLRAGVAINRDSELIPVARSGGITTALVRPTGGLIAGQASLIKLSGWTSEEMVMTMEAGLQINWPISKKKKQYRTNLVALFKQTRNYIKQKEGAKKNKQLASFVSQPKLDALIPYVQGKKTIFIEAISREAIAEALQFAEKEKLKIVITGGNSAWKLAKELKKQNVSVILGPVMQKPSQSYDPYDAPYANASRLYEAGVPFCIRSDNSTPGGYSIPFNAPNSRNTPFQAAQAVAFGLPEAEGLRAITLSAAKILGVEKEIGSLTVGKRANIVIATGNPLQQTAHIKGVFIDGVPHKPDSRQIRFYKKYRKRLQEK